MTAKEKTKLVKQAGKLYFLGVTVEKRRNDLRRLVEKKVSYDSPQMAEALARFQEADSEWKRLEQEHLDYRRQLGVTQNEIIK